MFLEATKSNSRPIRIYKIAGQNPNEIIRLNQYDESNYFANQIQSEYKLSKDGKHLLKGGLSYTRTKFNQPDIENLYMELKLKATSGLIVSNLKFKSRIIIDIFKNFHMS